MEKPVQWMTLQELREELERSRPAWEYMDLDGFLADGQVPVLSKDAHRHQVIADESMYSECTQQVHRCSRLSNYCQRYVCRSSL